MKIIKIKENKKRRLTIRGILSVSVAAIAIRSFFTGQYENLFTCILTLLLFCVPLYIDRRLRIDLGTFAGAPRTPSIRVADFSVDYTPETREAVADLYEQQLDIRIFADEFFHALRAATPKDSL